MFVYVYVSFFCVFSKSQFICDDRVTPSFFSYFCVLVEFRYTTDCSRLPERFVRETTSRAPSALNRAHSLFHSVVYRCKEDKSSIVISLERPCYSCIICMPLYVASATADCFFWFTSFVTKFDTIATHYRENDVNSYRCETFRVDDQRSRIMPLSSPGGSTLQRARGEQWLNYSKLGGGTLNAGINVELHGPPVWRTFISITTDTMRCTVRQKTEAILFFLNSNLCWLKSLNTHCTTIQLFPNCNASCNLICNYLYNLKQLQCFPNCNLPSSNLENILKLL